MTARKRISTLADEIAKLIAQGIAPESAREAATNARHERLRKPDIVFGGCFELADAMPDVDYVMLPALVQRQVLTLTGRPSHGKSTVAMAMAMALALGRELGPLKPLRSGLVYFLSVEDADGTRKRIYAEAVRHKLTPEERERVNDTLRWAHINTLLSPALIAEYIREDALGARVVAIFIDTGPALFAGDDENANPQIQAFAESCRALTEIEGSPCVVVFWHPVKAASADNLTPRGGSALIGAIDGNLTLWAEDDETTTLGHGKWRADHFDPIVFSLESVPLIMQSGAIANIKIAVPKTGAQIEDKESEATDRREKLLIALLAADGTEPQSVRRLAEIVGVGRSTAGRDLRHMAASKPALVAVDAVTDRYTLMKHGKLAANAVKARQRKAYEAASKGE